jgi:hypothetical protein
MTELNNELEMNKKEIIFYETSLLLMLGVFFGPLILNSFIAFNIQKTFTLPKGAITGLLFLSYILFIPIVFSRVVEFSKTKITLSNQELIVHRSSLIGVPEYSTQTEPPIPR